MRTLAEELLLLAYDDDAGRPHSESMQLDTALVAASLVDLMIHNAIELVPDPKPGRPDRVVLRRTDGAAPPDDLSAEILENADGKTVKNALTSLGTYSFRGRGGKLKTQILDDLVRDGILTQERKKALGFIPFSSWPTTDASVEAEIMDRVGSVLIDGRTPDDRTAALIALIAPLNLAAKIFPDADAKAVNARATQIAQADWAGNALQQAIAELQVVMFSLMVAPTVINSSSN